MMNNIDDYQNLIALLEQALKFYADERNYNGYIGTIAPIDSDEHGSQARFALSKIEEIKKINKQIQEDYVKITESYVDDDEVKGENLLKTLNDLKNTITNGDNNI
jgi:hypothetical protein